MTRSKEKWDNRKWDESDFTFQIEDSSKAKAPVYLVVEGRVLTDPPRTRTIKVGKGSVKITLCLHGKPIKYTCPTCEFEAPRLPQVEAS